MKQFKIICKKCLKEDVELDKSLEYEETGEGEDCLDTISLIIRCENCKEEEWRVI